MTQKTKGPAVRQHMPGRNSNRSAQGKRMNYDDITIAVYDGAIANGYQGAASDEVAPT